LAKHFLDVLEEGLVFPSEGFDLVDLLLGELKNGFVGLLKKLSVFFLEDLQLFLGTEQRLVLGAVLGLEGDHPAVFAVRLLRVLQLAHHFGVDAIVKLPDVHDLLQHLLAGLIRLQLSLVGPKNLFPHLQLLEPSVQLFVAAKH
jgi:hypothetical protein